MLYVCFFFKQKTAYEMRISDWSSDVCSSDLSAVQNWEMSFAPHEAQAEFYAKPDPLSCSAFNPGGAKVESVEGGWMLAGRWRYSSGVCHADWALLGAKVEQIQAPILLIVPKIDFRIEDTWQDRKSTRLNSIH